MRRSVGEPGWSSRIPLGADDERPEFRTVSWIAMMFSAGMGIGLMFFAVAEPLGHYMSPPPGTASCQSSPHDFLCEHLAMTQDYGRRTGLGLLDHRRNQCRLA